MSPIDSRRYSVFFLKNLRGLEYFDFRNVRLCYILWSSFINLRCMKWNRERILVGVHPLSMRIKGFNTTSFKLIILQILLNELIWCVETILRVHIRISWAGVLVLLIVEFILWFLHFRVSLFFIKRNLLFGFVFVVIFAINVILFASFLFLGKFWILRIWWLVLWMVVNA